MKKLFFFLMLVFGLSAHTQTTFDLGSQITGANPVRTTGGCVASCEPEYCQGVGTGNHPATQCTGIISVPAGEFLSLTIVTNACEANAGLDTGDGLLINGVSTGSYSSNQPVNYNGCFHNNTGSTYDFQIILTVNRRDETVKVTYSTSSTNPGGCSLLPIELSKFSATTASNNKAVLLKWTTASELNNAGFNVQRSNDGETWEDIDFVMGHGTTTEPQQYNFTDNSPVIGANYYRLKQTDTNGFFEFSPVRTATIKGNQVLIYPTITQGEITIVLPKDSNDETVVCIYNLQGVLVCRLLQEGNDTLTINLPQIISGLYLVEVTNGNKHETKQIFKQ